MKYPLPPNPKDKNNREATPTADVYIHGHEYAAKTGERLMHC